MRGSLELPRLERLDAPAMDNVAALSSSTFASLSEEIAKGLAYVSSYDAGAAFIVTPVMYANGSHVVCILQSLIVCMLQNVL